MDNMWVTEEEFNNALAQLRESDSSKVNECILFYEENYTIAKITKIVGATRPTVLKRIRKALCLILRTAYHKKFKNGYEIYGDKNPELSRFNKDTALSDLFIYGFLDTHIYHTLCRAGCKTVGDITTVRHPLYGIGPKGYKELNELLTMINIENIPYTG